MRFIRRLVLACILIAGGIALAVVLGTLVPNPLVFDGSDGETLSKRILVVSNTIHTDIAIPLDATASATFAFLADSGLPINHPDAQWLLIGWGGRSFYLETPSLADIKPGPTFRALTVDSSVMHVDVLAQIIETDPAILPIAISEAAYANLLATVAAGFTRKNGQVQPIEGFAFGSSDKFYEAEGYFNALVGCNVWTSRMLRSAGLTTGIWNSLPFSLTTSLGLFNSKQIEAALPKRG